MLSLAKLLMLSLALGASAGKAFAQDPIAAFPKNYSLAFDNDIVSVIRVHYGPHERIGVHDHSKFPTIYVYLSKSSPVRFEHDEKPAWSITRQPTSVGAFRVSPGRLERHAVENLGDTGSDFLRVELKQVPLGSDLKPFRGKPPGSPLQSSRAVEFRSSEVEVERIICEPGKSCNVDSSVSPALLVAFSPLQLAENDIPNQGEPMRDGDVKWVPGSYPTSVLAASSAPAHLLRISFGAVQK
jgi:hypothetical protein